MLFCSLKQLCHSVSPLLFSLFFIILYPCYKDFRYRRDLTLLLYDKKMYYFLNSAALFLVRYFYILKWHFWDLSIDMGIFWGSWFLHNHEIPHPNQWGSMITTKKYCLFNEDFSVVGFICI